MMEDPDFLQAIERAQEELSSQLKTELCRHNKPAFDDARPPHPMPGVRKAAAERSSGFWSHAKTYMDGVKPLEEEEAHARARPSFVETPGFPEPREERLTRCRYTSSTSSDGSTRSLGASADRLPRCAQGQVPPKAGLHFASEGGPDFSGLYSLQLPALTAGAADGAQHRQRRVDIGDRLPGRGQTRRVCPQGRFLIHPLHWTFEAGNVDHARLREYVGKLDNDLDRYAEIFAERTAGAAKPLAVRNHLSGAEKLITAAASLKAGMAHEVANASIPPDAVTWSVQTP